MSPLRMAFLSSLLVIFSAGCTKTEVLDDPPVDPPPVVPANPEKPHGILYIDGVAEFIKINTGDSSVIWTAEARNYGSSFDNPMTFDSGTFYHGNNSALTAYSTQTGLPRWSFYWIAFNDSRNYGEPAFKDSLVFITAQTSVWDHGFLACLNKNTGTLYWKKEIDAGDVNIPFTTTPMVAGNNVVVLTRDVNNHKRLTAFNIADATQSWTSEINDNLSLRLKLSGGKIYSPSRQTMTCYDATDGTLKWHTNLESVDPNEGISTFFERDKLVMVKVSGNVYNVISIDKANGNITKNSTLTVPTEMHDPVHSPLSCNYSNNKLYVATQFNPDTASVRSYDLSTLALKWEKRFAKYLYNGVPVLLTNKHLVFPINNSYPAGKSTMYFLDLEGNIAAGIPFNENYTDGHSYEEDGVMYRLHKPYTNW